MATKTAPVSTTWTFTCVNHPHLRWAKNKCGGGFIGGGVLMFQGDVESGKPGAPCSESEASLAKHTKSYREHFLAKYAAECDCPYSDLTVVAREYIPFSKQLRRPSTEQVKTFGEMVRLEGKRTLPDGILQAEMDEDGTLLVHLTEDGATTHARFGRDGQIIGSWF